MEDSQREAMYQGWARTKTFITPTKEVDAEKATVSAEYQGEIYKETFHKKDCYGSSDPYNIAFNRLWSRLKEINKNIELKY